MGKMKLMRGKTRNEKGITVTETKLEDVMTACKECKADPREYGSSRCEDCSMKYKAAKIQQAKFDRKVQEQINSK